MSEQQPWDKELNRMLILDRSGDFGESDVLYPFALEELLCRHVGEGGAPLLHLWRHPRAFVMGLRDSRLPAAGKAAAWLEGQGYAVAVRNSGGAAVPLDPGVVNVSLILPKMRQGDIDFHQDFERMYRLIREALRETGAGVDKGEIQGAYCPGDYDLSIRGRKFCGIAQRRQAHAYVVQAFVVAAGSGEARAQLARGFYERAAAAEGGNAGSATAAAADSTSPVSAAVIGMSATANYPQVTVSSMASLEQLTGLDGGRAAEQFAEAVKRVIRQRQTQEGLQSASERLWLPGREQVTEMINTLRTRYGIQR
ncbi:lipoate--protein ligase family protein [Paenibacillus allorhizosphaerae]|uniref:BPL/LPL catalytic domain-containing protein n=1 Tax=Paenibacillus allorhizosphaerae TaxID=2849866 RepID=A0ABN7TW92_9BACL|nr:lipoate--protein ligase family protein [Paenibacillus allorhizosphaerae]CAG7654455.1 hypothetical protein PAECIP111802_05781 [Paenibacillus allorhizosphaerae]